MTYFVKLLAAILLATSTLAIPLDNYDDSFQTIQLDKISQPFLLDWTGTQKKTHEGFSAVLNSFLRLGRRSADIFESDVKKQFSAADYYVKHLPGTENIARQHIPTMHAGYVSVNPEHDQKLFFWSFDAEYTVTERQKTVCEIRLFAYFVS